MSNGLFKKVEEIINSGEIPQGVSNELILAAVLENKKHTMKNSDAIVDNADNIADNVTQIKVARAADKKWGGIAVAIAAAISFIRPGG